MIDEQDLATYLTSKGVQVYKAAGSEISINCLWCQEEHKRGKLYLNTETWLFDCKVCGEAGNRRKLLEHFGDEDALTFAEGADPNVRRWILREATELAHELLLGNDEIIEYLLGRGLSDEMIATRKYGYVPRNFGLVDSLPSRDRFSRKDLTAAGLLTVGGRDFFAGHAITIPYWSHDAVVQIREKQIGGKYRTPGGDRTRLYNADSLLGASEVILTEGEFDCDMLAYALQQSDDRRLQAMAVCGLAGAGSWPEGFVESLQHLKRVFVGFDPDETGKRYAQKLRDEVGNTVRIVRLPEGLPKVDWSDYLAPRSDKNPKGGHTWRDVHTLITEADLAGKRVLSTYDAQIKWQRALTEAPGLKLGWTSMDAILRPGLKPGQVMIPLAATGTGKTAWLTNVAHNCRNVGVLYVSLEMTAVEVYEQLRRIHRFWYPQATREQLVDEHRGLYIDEQNRIRPGDLEIYIAEYEEATGRRPGLLIVDYLQYYARGFRGSTGYERTTDAVMELKAVGKSESLPIIAPSQVNRTAEHGRPLTIDNARDAGTVEETGDFVMALFRPELAKSLDGELPPPTGAFNAQLLKSRHGGVGRSFNLRFSPLSLAIVDALDRVNAARVEQEVNAHRQGVHYFEYEKQILAQHSQDQIPGVGA